MRTYISKDLSPTALIPNLISLVSQERTVTAAVLAHIAEVDFLKLYRPAGYQSMHDFCVEKLHFSEQAALKRIRAGRTARQFPAIFDALAEGRLHLSAVVLLKPHLTPDNAADLLAAAAYQTKAQIEQLIARRFPKPDVPTRIEAISPPSLSPGTVETDATQLSPGTVEAPIPFPRVAPLSAERFALQFTIGKDTHDKLRYIQALLSHRFPSGDLAQVFDRALDALKGKLEKQKFAATTKPRPGSRSSSANARHIPADVSRAVWLRDQGQCTFVGDDGHRCSARTFVEFDHIDPVARGGRATVDNLRLRCRGHNQYEAERIFGVRFMNDKREEAGRAAADARIQRAAAKPRAQAAEARPGTIDKDRSMEVMACPRNLGFRAGEARDAVAFCETIPDATLENHVRAALKFLCPRPRGISLHAPA